MSNAETKGYEVGDAKAEIGEAMRGRLDDLSLLVKLGGGGYSLDETQMFDVLDLEGPANEDEVREAAWEMMNDYPLCVETKTTFEIVIGTGGPHDEIAVECSREAMGESLAIRRVLYRYSWSGSAEIELAGEDKEVAERFARQVVPELVE